MTPDAEEARTRKAQASAEFWAIAAAYVRNRQARDATPEGIRLHAIRAQIAAVDARQRAAEAPYVAQEIEIEREIERLKAKLAATYEARCAVAAPFECELDKLYEEKNNVC
jgi:hypothetical protein